MKNGDYIVSIDAGTSGIKTLILDEKGNIIISRSIRNNVQVNKNGFVEQDMEALWENTFNCIKHAISESSINTLNIRAVVISGQGEGLWLLDKSYKPMGNAILWNDSRAMHTVEKIRNDVVIYDKIKQVTGSYPKSGSTLVLLKWLKETNPSKFEKINYCLSCKDWLRYKMTSEAYSEITEASTSCLDIQSGKYASDLFAQLDMPEIECMFPLLRKPVEVSGYVTKQAAIETGIPEGVPVSSGMLDIVSTSVGAGATSVGDICIILGTSCINEMTTDAYVFEKNMTGWERHIDGNLYINVSGAMTGTPNIDWGLATFMDGLKCTDRNMRALEENMKMVPAGSNGIIYHPYISLSGERAPFFEPRACGQFSGIKSTTTKFELMKSIYEGVALSSKDCLYNFKNKNKVFLTGGGAKSLFWARIITDCLGTEVIIPEGEEFSAIGGAISASVAIGMFNSVNDAVNNFCKAGRSFEPDLKQAEIYNEIFEAYVSIRNSSQFYWEWRDKFMDKHVGDKDE